MITIGEDIFLLDYHFASVRVTMTINGSFKILKSRLFAQNKKEKLKTILGTCWDRQLEWQKKQFYTQMRIF